MATTKIASHRRTRAPGQERGEDEHGGEQDEEMRRLGERAQGVAPDAVEHPGQPRRLEGGALEEERVRQRRPAVGDGDRAVEHEREAARRPRPRPRARRRSSRPGRPTAGSDQEQRFVARGGGQGGRRGQRGRARRARRRASRPPPPARGRAARGRPRSAGCAPCPARTRVGSGVRNTNATSAPARRAGRAPAQQAIGQQHGRRREDEVQDAAAWPRARRPRDRPRPAAAARPATRWTR